MKVRLKYLNLNEGPMFLLPVDRSNQFGSGVVMCATLYNGKVDARVVPDSLYKNAPEQEVELIPQK